MIGWPIKTLGEVCDLVNGATPDTKVKDYWGGTHAWITPAEMGGLDSPFLSVSRRTLSDKGLASCSATLVPPKTVIISSRAPIGHLVINEVPMATNQGCKSLIPKEGLDFNFLYYYLKANVELLESLGTGTTFKELSGTQLKTVTIPVPALEEQKRIVELLDAATARVTELTECYEQARTHANNLFASVLQDALESNPDWPVKTLGEVCEFQNGYAFRSSEYVKNGHALIRIKNVQQGEILPSDDVFVQIPKDGALDQFVLKAGDILMSLTGYLGRVGRLDETDLPAALNQRVAKVSVKSKALMFDGFLYRALDSQWFRNQVEVYGRGAAQQNVGTSDISKIEIPVPPLDEQKRIVARLDLMKKKTSEMVTAYDAKLTAAKDLRQSILEAAFAGVL